MPTAFIEQRFPPNISYGSKGGPSFNTSVFTASSGYEQRNINWEAARCKYDVSHGIRDTEDMNEVLDFFYAVRGKATGFRYKDWADYKLTQGQIGVGNGTEDEFQIVKKYQVGSETYTRTLRKIVTPSAGPPAILFEVYVNDVLKTITTDYTINYNTGVITFGVRRSSAVRYRRNDDYAGSFRTPDVGRYSSRRDQDSSIICATYL